MVNFIHRWLPVLNISQPSLTNSIRIVTWNCNGAFRKKAHAIAAFQPDIAVIQECERPEKLLFKDVSARPAFYSWFGDDNGKKGILLASYTDVHFEVDARYDKSIRHCIPIRVSGGIDCHLLAVWAMESPERRQGYIGRLVKATEIYQQFLNEKPSCVIGDWNSNANWDQEKYGNPHKSVVSKLEELQISSAYHHRSGEKHGSERENTFYMYRNQEKCFHIDYCFLPNSWLKRVKKVSVGTHKEWYTLSDHSPIFVELSK